MADLIDTACPECGDTNLYFEGFCPECGFDAEDLTGMETAPADGPCPRCKSEEGWDEKMGYCYDCDYDAINDAASDIHATVEVEESPGLGYLSAFSKWTKWESKPAEPYKPFRDLAEKMKRWPFFRLYSTDHWLNKLYSKLTRKFHGMDVTWMPKALGPFVFIPKYQFDTETGYKTLAHEACHARDFWKFGVIPFFLMQYILPYGPSGVALLEYRAYVEMMKAEADIYGRTFITDPARYASALASRGYRYCFPWPKLMEKFFRNAQAKIDKAILKSVEESFEKSRAADSIVSLNHVPVSSN